jgi:hypothetical protein
VAKVHRALGEVAAVHRGGVVEREQRERGVPDAAAHLEKHSFSWRDVSRPGADVPRRGTGLASVGVEPVVHARRRTRRRSRRVLPVGGFESGTVAPVVAAAADVRAFGKDVRELAREVVPVLEELVLVVLVEDVPVLARVLLVLLHPELRRRWSARSGRVRSVSGNGRQRG